MEIELVGRANSPVVITENCAHLSESFSVILISEDLRDASSLKPWPCSAKIGVGSIRAGKSTVDSCGSVGVNEGLWSSTVLASDSLFRCPTVSESCIASDSV